MTPKPNKVGYGVPKNYECCGTILKRIICRSPLTLAMIGVAGLILLVSVLEGSSDVTCEREADASTFLAVHQHRANSSIEAQAWTESTQPGNTSGNTSGIRDEVDPNDERYLAQLAALQARINARLAASEDPNSLPVVIATAIEFIAEKLADVDVTVVDIDDDIQVADQDLWKPPVHFTRNLSTENTLNARTLCRAMQTS